MGFYSSELFEVMDLGEKAGLQRFAGVKTVNVLNG